MGASAKGASTQEKREKARMLARPNCYLKKKRGIPWGPQLHIHAFDQCYFVLSSEMTMQPGIEQDKFKWYDIALITAGVPHCQRNEGPEPASHITMNIPGPDADVSRWDLQVDFAVKGSAV